MKTTRLKSLNHLVQSFAVESCAATAVLQRLRLLQARHLQPVKIVENGNVACFEKPWKFRRIRQPGVEPRNLREFLMRLWDFDLYLKSTDNSRVSGSNRRGRFGFQCHAVLESVEESTVSSIPQRNIRRRWRVGSGVGVGVAAGVDRASSFVADADSGDQSDSSAIAASLASRTDMTRRWGSLLLNQSERGSMMPIALRMLIIPAGALWALSAGTIAPPGSADDAASNSQV
jgi:hypothetical protein